MEKEEVVVVVVVVVIPISLNYQDITYVGGTLFTM